MRPFNTFPAVLLSSIATLSSAAALPTTDCNPSHFRARDEFQAGGLVCIYLTTEVNWTGEAQNLCQVAGQCCNISHLQFPLMLIY
jgi:hypothetical protein